jgi:hypothetical protein
MKKKSEITFIFVGLFKMQKKAAKKIKLNSKRNEIFVRDKRK